MAERESTREGIAVDADQISLTNGSMQAVTLMAEALMAKPGDPIIVEELCYMGTIHAYKEVGARLVGVPLDEHGMRLDCLEQTLEELCGGATPPAPIAAPHPCPCCVVCCNAAVPGHPRPRRRWRRAGWRRLGHLPR